MYQLYPLPLAFLFLFPLSLRRHQETTTHFKISFAIGTSTQKWQQTSILKRFIYNLKWAFIPELNLFNYTRGNTCSRCVPNRSGTVCGLAPLKTNGDRAIVGFLRRAVLVTRFLNKPTASENLLEGDSGRTYMYTHFHNNLVFLFWLNSFFTL